MPVVSNNPFIPRAVTPQPPELFDLSGLDTEAKSSIFQNCLDARAMNTLLGDTRWNESVRSDDFDRAARGIIKHFEHAPLGSWPPVGDWALLADKAGAFRDRCPNAALLSNIAVATSRMSAGLVTAAQAMYDAPIPNVSLAMGGSRLLRAPGRPPDLMAERQVPGGTHTKLVSGDGQVRDGSLPAGCSFAIDQYPWMCEAVDSMRLDVPERLWVLRNKEATKATLYSPTAGPIEDLPDILAKSVLCATSNNGRYVVTAAQNAGEVLLHDRANPQQPVRLPFPVRRDDKGVLPWQLSVDSCGAVFIASPELGLQFTADGVVRQVTLDRKFSNFRLAPDERYLVVNDAAGNLRLEDRQGLASKTLLHPTAVAPTLSPPKVLALVESPGRPWLATTSDDGRVLVYNLVGAEHDAKLEPVVEVSLRMQSPASRIQNAALWFSPDASELHVGYTELSPNPMAPRTVQLMRLQLV